MRVCSPLSAMLTCRLTAYKRTLTALHQRGQLPAFRCRSTWHSTCEALQAGGGTRVLALTQREGDDRAGVIDRQPGVLPRIPRPPSVMRPPPRKPLSTLTCDRTASLIDT
ncbi:uncharacterized protein LOC122259722 [Penaeus japonicus]|uniref:uncharacterized protein LOC122259722 n=1 Tax=Penaeus japonicus TaxID=27405 RepID=UPI001C70EFE8|nr:uncharacterized protein LOC122259722 [Penaeus japonicus]